MASLSVTQAWNETAEFVKRESGLLFPLAFMLIALPLALMEVFTPVPAAPGEMPPAGLWLLLFPIAMVASLIGNVAISHLALRPGVSVGEAIGRGARSFPSLLGAFLLLMIAAAIAFFVVTMIMVMIVPGAIADAQSGAVTGAIATATLLTLLAMLPLMLFFWARLMLMTPVAAAEQAGPIALIARSWALTRGHALKLVGFMLLVLILVMVVSLAVQAVAGLLFALVAGPPEPGSTSRLLVTLVMAGVNTVITACLTSFIARIYARLAGGGEERVFV